MLLKLLVLNLEKLLYNLLLLVAVAASLPSRAVTLILLLLSIYRPRRLNLKLFHLVQYCALGCVHARLEGVPLQRIGLGHW